MKKTFTKKELEGFMDDTSGVLAGVGSLYSVREAIQNIEQHPTMQAWLAAKLGGDA